MRNEIEIFDCPSRVSIVNVLSTDYATLGKKISSDLLLKWYPTTNGITQIALGTVSVPGWSKEKILAFFPTLYIIVTIISPHYAYVFEIAMDG